jgi:hypothetical protein
MESTKKGMPESTPILSNYRSTGESFTTGQSYINQSFFQSFFSQFNTADELFYSGAISQFKSILNDTAK